jgi:hypothetical protein
MSESICTPPKKEEREAGVCTAQQGYPYAVVLQELEALLAVCRTHVLREA